jgi:hypothetical protein
LQAGPGFFELAGPLLSKRVARQVHGDLDSLKAHLETGLDAARRTIRTREAATALG